jgi:hypothetical protein
MTKTDFIHHTLKASSMKRLKTIIAATALLATVAGASASQPESTRIMTYNIRNGVGYDNQRNI